MGTLAYYSVKSLLTLNLEVPIGEKRPGGTSI